MDENNNVKPDNNFTPFAIIGLIVLAGTIVMTVLGYFFFESLFGALSLFTFMFGLVGLVVVRSDAINIPRYKMKSVNRVSLILILTMITSIASLVVTSSWIW